MNKVKDVIKQATSTIKFIFGIPDYERYLRQHQHAHKDCHHESLSEKDFYLQALKDRYESGKVNRCC